MPRFTRFGVLSLSTWLVIVVVWGSYALFGHAFLRVLYEAEATPRWMVRIQERADDLAGASLALFVSAWCLYALFHFWNEHDRRWWILAGGGLALYAGVETLAAPLLENTLGLNNFYFVRDPDHWPGPHVAHYVEMGGMNQDWVRTPLERTDFEEEGLNLVFLGDSFTYGFGVPGEKAFPALVGWELERRFPEATIRVANFGWVSSSPVLSLRRLRHLGDAYRPDLVVLCVDMTDFHDDIKWKNMLERRGIYRLYDRIPITLKIAETWLPGLFWLLYRRSLENLPEKRFFATEQPLEESRPHLATITESIAAIDAFCRERGWSFVLFVLPRGYQYSDRESPRNWEAEEYVPLGPWCLEPFRFFEELAARVDHPVHSLLPAFRESDVFPTCFEDDPHWNEAGHRVAARAIVEHLAPQVEALLRRR